MTAIEHEDPFGTQLPIEKSVPKCSDTVTPEGADASGTEMVPVPLEATETVPRFRAGREANSPEGNKKREERSRRGRLLARTSRNDGIYNPE